MSLSLAITAVEEAAPGAPFVLRGPFAQSIPHAAELGFDAIELHIADPAEVDAEAILEGCRGAGIRVSSIGTGLAFLRDGVTLVHPDEPTRATALQRLEHFIDLAARLDCVVIIGLIKGQVRDVGERTLYLQRLTEALRHLTARAEGAGVTLVLEAVNRYESDIFNTLAETAAFIEGFGSDRLKLHVDTFHMNVEEDRIAANIAAAGSRIGHVHVADSNRRAPGTAHYDFAATISALKDAGYTGVLSVECLGLPDPDTAARQAQRFLKGCL
jgi:sugar phosphate isomerase/epimerase